MAGNTGNIGGQLGNRNSAKGREWSDAVRKVANEECPKKRRKRLINIAYTLIEMAEGGNMSAIIEIGNRLDGKPMQSIEGDFKQEITKIERVIVKPDDIETVIEQNGIETEQR